MGMVLWEWKGMGTETVLPLVWGINGSLGVLDR